MLFVAVWEKIKQGKVEDAWAAENEVRWEETRYHQFRWWTGAIHV